MRVLVLGGTGFLGPDVVRGLVGWGHRVAIFHRGEREVDLPPTVAHIHGDRDELTDYRDAFAQVRPDVVLDMQPMLERHARLVTETFRDLSDRLVAISSADVYRAYGRLHRSEPGSIEPVPLSEDAPLRERLYPYRELKPTTVPAAPWLDDYDKILVERAVMGAERPLGTVLRLGMVHGPRSYRHYPAIRRMIDRRPAILLDDAGLGWRSTYAYSEDVARAIALAVTDDRAIGRVYNIGLERALSRVELLSALARVAGWGGEVMGVPHDRLPEHLREEADLRQDLVLDTGRIRRELGYREEIDLHEGLRRTVGWMRDPPPPADHPLVRTLDYGAEDRVVLELRTTA